MWGLGRSQDPCFVPWNPDVSNQPRETKIGLTNRVVREIRGKISVRLRGGNEFWLELSVGILEESGFEKSGFHYIMEKAHTT